MQGADLVNIQNVGENEFIWSLLPQGCYNYDSNCDSYSDNKDYYCAENTEWMSTNCRETCGLCEGSCVNRRSSTVCDTSASQGYCQSIEFRYYMWETCALACGCNHMLKEGFWIGFNDLDRPMHYKWAGTDVINYTNWAHNGVDNYDGKGEDCVVMHRLTGTWSDELCNRNTSGYVCQKPKQYRDELITDSGRVGCPQNTVLGYHGNCLSIHSEAKSWKDAKKYCEDQNAWLAIPRNRRLNAFLAAEIYNAQVLSQVWIGLSAEGTDYKFVDQTALTFSPWSSDHTGMEEDQCVALDETTKWHARTCTDVLPFACETARSGYTTSAPRTDQVTGSCQGGWTEREDLCYKVFGETTDWHSANDACRVEGGSLMSIHDSDTNDFVMDTLLHDAGLTDAFGVWIGLRYDFIDESLGWADGTGFNWQAWSSPVRNEAYTELCGEYMLEGKVWRDISCYDTKPYICSIERGTIYHTTHAPIPESYCDTENTWRKLDGDCYQVFDTYLDWRSARTACNNMQADLVSIRNLRTNDFLLQLLGDSGIDMFWIGYSKLMAMELSWTDKTPKGWEYFRPGQPNDDHGEAKCVAMDIITGKWSDENCGKLLGFICKKHDGDITPMTLPPPTTGLCPDDFVSEGFSNKCYYLGGISASDGGLKSWKDAKEACKHKNSNAQLASIQGDEEQAFVTLIMEEAQTNVWIGLHDLENGFSYLWEDNTPFNYAQWGSQTVYQNGITRPCVALLRYGQQISKWSDESCTTQYAYLCQAEREPHGDDTEPRTFSEQYSNSECNDGYFYYHKRCYKLYKEEKTWEDAKKTCEDENGALALSWDIWEKERFYYEALDDQGSMSRLWLDVKFDDAKSAYVWDDQHEISLAFWAYSEPDLADATNCAYLQHGSWFETDCSEEMFFICVADGYHDRVPTTPDPSKGKCSGENQEAFGDHCYWASEPEVGLVSWPEANRQCNRRGMDMVSIHSDDETQFVKQLVTDTRGISSNIWIGLERGIDSTFRWDDGSTSNYFPWAEGVQSTLGGDNAFRDEECVEMIMEDGKWNDLSCDIKLAYVCKTMKEYPPSVLPTIDFEAPTLRPDDFQGEDDDDNDKGEKDDGDAKQDTGDDDDDKHGNDGNGNAYQPGGGNSDNQRTADARQNGPGSSGMSGGAIAGLIIGLLCAVVFVSAAVYFVVLKRRPLWLQKSVLLGGRKTATGFDNALYSNQKNDDAGADGIVDFGYTSA